MPRLNFMGPKKVKLVSFFGRPVYASGFTLIELMVTIAIIGLVALFGIPAFGDFVLNNRLRGQTSDFIGQLTHARSEAMRTATRVTVCPGTSSGCSGTQWENGWVVFNDTNANAAVDSGETVIGIGAALDGGNTLRTAAFTTYISFRHDGSSTNVAGSGLAGSFAQPPAVPGQTVTRVAVRMASARA